MAGATNITQDTTVSVGQSMMVIGEIVLKDTVLSLAKKMFPFKPRSEAKVLSSSRC